MSAADHYSAHDRERYVAEPPKRAGRTPFERDRGRILHSSALRRLSAKTQVMGAGADDFVRNRLTHSLEVAQVARELGAALGCDPDVVDSAALAHDLGHPPYGHNGERALDNLADACGGFEGNAQTLRLLTRLEAKTVAADGNPVGLNLTRATLAACTKYPWGRGESPDGGPKFGVYPDDRPIFAWVIAGAPGGRRPIEAQVMDLADDIAYSVHDVEDAVVGGWFDLADFGPDADLTGVLAVARDWYDPSITADRLGAALERLRSLSDWPGAPGRPARFDGSRAALASLKGLTSALIGRFATAAHAATREAAPGPFVRYGGDLIVPDVTRDEITVLKAIAADRVMLATDRAAELDRQRAQLTALVGALLDREGRDLEPALAADFAVCADDAARLRVAVDQVASLTDLSAPLWAERLGL